MAGAAHPLAQPPPPLVEWSDDVLNAIFCRVPFLSHGTVRAVCRRTRTLLSSPAFRKERLESGYAESGVIVAGGSRDGGNRTAECWLLAGGRWWPRAPMSGPRSRACSAVIDNELWVCGGDDDALGGRGVLSATNTWRSLPALNEAARAVCGVVGALWSSLAALMVGLISYQPRPTAPQPVDGIQSHLSRTRPGAPRRVC